jgi:hypothetical protein
MSMQLLMMTPLDAPLLPPMKATEVLLPKKKNTFGTMFFNYLRAHGAFNCHSSAQGINKMQNLSDCKTITSKNKVWNTMRSSNENGI